MSSMQISRAAFTQLGNSKQRRLYGEKKKKTFPPCCSVKKKKKEPSLLGGYFGSNNSIPYSGIQSFNEMFSLSCLLLLSCGQIIPFELASGPNKWNIMVNDSQVLLKR